MTETFEQLKIETENFTKPCKRYRKEMRSRERRQSAIKAMNLGDEMLNERLHV